MSSTTMNPSLDQFAKDIENHQMQVLVDDDLHRSLLFKHLTPAISTSESTHGHAISASVAIWVRLYSHACPICLSFSVVIKSQT